MRLLIVEDDPTLRGFIAQGLTREHFTVEQASNSADAMTIASEKENPFDFIITDLRMPGPHDGQWLVRELRKARVGAVIFVMTGKAEEEDELNSLNAGADDYILKPFELAVLMAKLRVWINRRKDFLSSEVNSTMLTAGDVRLDVLRRRALRGDRIIPLTAQEFNVLEYLIRHKGKIVTQMAILQAVWNHEHEPETNVVGVAINRLRKKLDGTQTTPFIKTIIGSGYIVDDEDSPSA